MKYFLLINLFTILFFGCQSKKQLSQNLTANCFWDILDKRYTKAPNTCYKFGKNGRASYFQYRFNQRIKTDTVELYNDDDNPRPDTWDVEGDSILNVRGYRMKVIKYDSDSVFLNFHNYNDSIVLIRNCKTVAEKNVSDL